MISNCNLQLCTYSDKNYPAHYPHEDWVLGEYGVCPAAQPSPGPVHAAAAAINAKLKTFLPNLHCNLPIFPPWLLGLGPGRPATEQFE